MERIVACCGTFDGDIHPGHVNFLQEARKLGEILIVLVNTDEVVLRNKHRQPLYLQDERIRHVAELGIADRVIAFHGDDDEQLQLLIGIAPQIYCDGAGNFNEFHERTEEVLLPLGTMFVRIPRFESYSTTALHFSESQTNEPKQLPANEPST